MNSSTTETLSQQRRTLLLINGTGFAVWELAQLDMLRANVPADMVWTMISLSGAILWAVTLFLLMRFGPNGKIPKVRLAALNDELALQNRYKAFQTGFFFAVGVAGGLYMLAGVIEFVARDALLLVLVAGVTSATYRFAFLEGDSE